ncbi:MAG: methyltransferase domain-containing protein [Rhodospirillales bacterium]|nr:methyltransferase domain-containing protein [Rhodospirillales bacterium]MCB9964678.1 methyltransferase domain-containing protein [Rhodospirillales bacterium]MCB9979968.1 methyltransferase domain-containing protein [Rhodospirillales bacterium]
MKKNLGAFYDETSDFQQAQFNYLTKFIKDHLPVEAIETLLDIGAGTGKRTKDCFDIFPSLSHILALEPDPDMFAQAIHHHNDERIEYLRKSAAYIGQMPRESGPFDLVLSHWTLHWIQNKTALFKDLERVVEPGSYFVLSSCERLPQILEDIDLYVRSELGISPSGESPFHYQTRSEWEALLKTHGWTIKAAENFTVDHVVRDAKEYLEHWFTTSTGKSTYNRHLVEISDLARSDLVWFMERKYGRGEKSAGLQFNEDVVFIVAEK